MLNTYAHSENNPILKTDLQSKCDADIAVAEKLVEGYKSDPLFADVLPASSNPDDIGGFYDQLLENLKLKMQNAKKRQHVSAALQRITEDLQPLFGDKPEGSIRSYSSDLEFYMDVIIRQESKKDVIWSCIPKHWAFMLYGSCLYDQHQYNKSAEAYKMVLSIDPFSADAYFELAEINKIHGDMDRMLKLIKQAYEFACSPENLAKCYRYFGFYLIERQRYVDAAACLYLSNHYHFSPAVDGELFYISQITGKQPGKPSLEDMRNALKRNDFPDKPSVLVTVAHALKAKAICDQKKDGSRPEEYMPLWLTSPFEAAGKPQ